MRLNNMVSAFVISSTALVGCSSVPEQNATLNDARRFYQEAQNNPDVTKHAAVELQQAGAALEGAEIAWKKDNDEDLIEHLAYLAKQRAVIAQDTGKLKSAELEIASVSAERDKVRLSMRTSEANAAAAQVVLGEQTAVRKAAEVAAATAMAESNKLRQSEISAEATKRAADELTAANTKLGQMEAELAELNAKKTERGLVITLGDVLFDVNKAEIKSGAERNVQKIADFLNEYPERKAVIEGFTDNTGSDDYNQSLSQRRAEAVRLFIIDKGISRERIEARGYGKANPVASNESPATRQLNRRVEIVLSDDSGNVLPR